MSAIDRLQKCLQELADCRQRIIQNVKSNLFFDSASEAIRYCEDIEQITLNDIDVQELGLASKFLFDSKTGIIKFLVDTAQIIDSTLSKAKIALLEFLFLYIQKVRSDIEPYSIKIKDACFTLQNNDEAVVRAASFKPMVAMLDSTVRIIDPEKMHIEDILHRYLDYIFVQSKKQQSVKVMAECLTTLGIIAYRFPEHSEQNRDKILRVFLNKLKDPNHSNAAFKGLHYFLFSFPDSLHKVQEEYVFQCILRSTTMVENESHYDIAKTGFDYISDHSSIFENYYLKHYREVWECLWKCRDHKNPDIAALLNSNYIGQHEKQCVETSNIDQKQEVESKDQQTKDLSIAVRGVGYFAAPAKKFMEEGRLQQLFQDLLKPSAWVVSSMGYKETSLNVQQIPLFVEAYCYIGHEFDVIFDELMEVIEREVGLMLMYYPRLISELRLRSANAYEQLLWMLYMKGRGVLQKFVAKSFFQAMVLTCTDAIQHKSQADIQENIPGIIDTVTEHTYQEMFNFWEHIFKDSTLTWVIRQSGLSSEEPQNNDTIKEFFSVLYDEFLSAVFRLIRTLNFDVIDVASNDTVQTTESGSDSVEKNTDSNLIAIAGSGDLDNLKPVVSKDFVLFQNLVDFWKLFLPRIRYDLFSRWVYLSGDTLITFSTQYPYVSGFYKMLGTCMKVCENIKFFDGIKKINDETAIHSMHDQLSPSATSLQRASYFLFTKFLKEVCVRLDQYKDDLLASCLDLVLSAPRELCHMDILISPIRIALKLGQSYQPLANIGLNAIENLLDMKDSQNINKLLGQILPLLNDYLLVTADTIDNSLKEIAQVRADAQSLARGGKTVEQARKQKIRAVDKNKKRTTTVGVGHLKKNAGLHNLQVRVLRILGRLGGISKLIFERIVDSEAINRTNKQQNIHGFKDQNSSNNLLAWDPDKKLTFNIPYPDASVEISIDEFLPRIVELAESAPDRKTKVFACELLHSIMLLMIGRSAFQARSKAGPQKSPFYRIYRRIFPALLRLAIDTDQVPRKLFRRLVAQMIHWFTNNAQYENPETIALLQCCLDAICDTWGSLRDYGAECLNEFLLWSIKQSSAQQMDENPMNIKSLLKRLYNLSAHPDYTKRLGASLAVNHIYRVYREEEPLIDQFTFELLYWILFNLKLSDQDQDAIGTRQQAISAIRHLKKIIIVRSDLFINEADTRRKFPNLDKADLSSLVKWLFNETCKLERDYANMCRELFSEFVVLLTDFKSGSRWVSYELSKDPLFLANLYKTATLSSLPSQHHSVTSPKTKGWCLRFLCVLENYTWLIREKFVTPLVLIENERSIFQQAIDYFLEKMVLNVDSSHSNDIMDVDNENSFSSSINSENILTPGERLQWLNREARMIDRLIDFVIAILEYTNNNDIQNVWNTNIFSNPFFKTIARSLFYFESLGLNLLYSGGNERDKFTEKLENLLTLWKKRSSPDDIQRTQMFKEIADIAFSDDVDLLCIEIEKSDPASYIYITDGFKILTTTEIFPELFAYMPSHVIRHNTLHEYTVLIWEKFKSLRNVQEPVWIDLASHLLTFVLSNNPDALNRWLLSDILGFPSHSSHVSYHDSSLYYQKFSSSINEHISRNFEGFAVMFCESINDTIVKDVIWGVIDYLSFRKNPEQISSFLKDFTSSSHFLSQFSKGQRFLLKLWKGLLKLDRNLLRHPISDDFKQLFFDTYVSFLEKNIELDFKSEALDILPIFIKSDMPIEKIESCISEILNNQFPLWSSDYKSGGPRKYPFDSDADHMNVSVRLNEYISVLDGLLKAMVRSSSVSLFKILVPIFVRENDHIYSEEFYRKLGEFVSNLPRSKFVETLEIAFGYFMDSKFANFHRNIIQSILSPTLIQGTKIFVVEFYKRHIRELIKIIEQDIHPRTDSEIIYELDAKAGSFTLLQISFIDDIYSEKGEIVQSYFEGRISKAKELTRIIMDFAHKIKSKSDNDEYSNESVVEAKLLLRCAAYNALAAAILCTQDNTAKNTPVFYKTFLFADNILKGEFVWENIVDLKTKHHFSADSEQPFFKTKLDDFRTRTGGLSEETKSTNNLKYLASQYLADSSVSQNANLDSMIEEITQEFDANVQIENNNSAPMEVDDPEKTLSEPRELEIDSFNRNPCMKMIIRVIERLHTEITPPNTSESTPIWMNDLHKKFTKKAFEKYASIWIRPLMQLIIEGDMYGKGINYFIQDLCAVIIVWSSFETLGSFEDKVLIYKLMDFLMRNACSENRAVLRNNLQAIKGMFEAWPDSIVVPTQVIYDYLSSSDENLIITGLQLYGIALTHDKPLFQQDVGVDFGALTEDKFYWDLTRKLDHEKSNIRSLAAEVCGMALRNLRKYYCSDDKLGYLLNPIMEKVTTFYKKITNRPTDLNTFLTCIHHISMHDRPTSEKFLKYAFNLLPRLNSLNVKKILALEVISYCAESDPDLLTNLGKSQLLALLRHRSDNEQLVALRILNGVLLQGDETLIDYFLDPLIESFRDHPNIDCRESFYAILIQLYKKTSEESNVKQKLKVSLLRGLADLDENIQQTLTVFWKDQQELSQDTFTLLRELVGYIETLFLQYSCFLLLEGSKKSIDYKKPIFDQPLPQSNFDDSYDNIDTSWRVSNTMTPLFVNTQKNNPKANYKRNIQEGFVRATNKNYAFSLTVDPMNYDIGSQLTTWTFTQSNLLFPIGNAPVLGKRKQDIQGDTDKTSKSIQSSQYQKLRRRFLPTYSGTQQEYYKNLAYTKKKRNEIYSSIRPDTVSKQVSMLRQYRVGELPDIEIKHSDIIGPLQALAHRDLDISRILFSTLFVSIYDATRDATIMDANEQIDYINSMSQNFQTIFNATTSYFPPLISSCLRICYEIPDIKIDPFAIRKASEISSTESMGIGLIEQHLTRITTQRGPKRARITNTGLVAESKRPWIELAHLYKSIDSSDVYKSIYENYIAHNQYTKNALNAELIGDYASACEFYLQALSEVEDADDAEVTIWEEGRFECFEKLSKWDDLVETVYVDIDSDLDKLWDQEFQYPYLQYFMHSLFKLVHGQNDASYCDIFFNFIDSSLSDQDRKSFLTAQYPIELALTSITRNDTDQALFYIRKAYDNFLFTWSTLHPLASSTRLSKLSSLQQIVEMEEYLNFCQSSEKSEKWEKLISHWKNRYPSKRLDPSNSWDDIITSRHSLLGSMTKLLQGDMHFDEVKSSLERDGLLKMASAARVQGNFEVARVCLNKTRQSKLCDNNELAYHQLKLNLQEALTIVNLEKKLSILVAMTDEFKKVQIMDVETNMKNRVIESETYSTLAAVLDNNESRDLTHSIQHRKAHFIVEGYNLLKDTAEEATSHLKPLNRVKIFVKFAKFCDYYLRNLESTDGDQKRASFDSELYASTVVQYVLKAMEECSKDASELFPRLLQIIIIYDNTQSTFKQMVSSFGTVWKFIRWIPQIVAILDKPIAHCVFPILYNLAEQYPKSLYYPLKISSEHYNFDEKSKESEINKSRVQNLKQLIKCEITDTLIAELQRLTDSEVHFGNWIQTVFTTETDQYEEIKNSFQKMRTFLLDIQNPHYGLFLLPKEFANRHAEHLIKSCGRDGSKLARFSQSEFREKVWDYYAKNIKRGEKKSPSVANLLKSYSKWLADFSSSNCDEEIEIPGQYDGLSIPDPSRHIKIAYFDPKVLVLKSLRKPKKIVIIGTDGKEYPFLVKGGEDLRLDQRVQQLFTVMNELMRKDYFCSQRKIELITYKVVPITGSLGIIEWINDTKPLRSFIEKELSDASDIENTQNEHMNWVNKYNGYPNVMKKAPRDDIIKHLATLHSMINRDLLKTALYKLAASPEVHLAIRNEFVKNLAAINICGYLIGIGDRHLENYLIDLTKGSLISIDFGHAFGSATETLEVPELVPFRLTRQFESIMEPLGSRGLLEYPMTKIMQCKSDLNDKPHKDILLNAMEIFVKEPLLDWQTRARNQARQQKNAGSSEFDESSQTSEWYPRQKLDIARRKLEGENPVYLVCEELAFGHSKKLFFENIQKIARGDREHNIRARVPQKCGSIKEQVECLIDLASDPVVLGIMWVGWL
ncbi:16904_t:CDS:10, partial [Cetraspora pellucida]